MLLDAYNTPNPAYMTMPVTEYTPVQPIPGGNIINPQTDTVQYNVATVTDTLPGTPLPSPANGPIDTPADTQTPAPSPPASDMSALLWIAAGLGGAYLLTQMGTGRSAGTVGKKKGSILIPLVLVGGVAAWYFMSSKDDGTTTTTTTTTPTGGTPVVDATKQKVLTWATGQPKVISVLTNADAETLRRIGLLIDMWTAGWSSNQIYSVGMDGTTKTTWDNSIGKWWENYSKANF